MAGFVASKIRAHSARKNASIAVPNGKVHRAENRERKAQERERKKAVSMGYDPERFKVADQGLEEDRKFLSSRGWPGATHFEVRLHERLNVPQHRAKEVASDILGILNEHMPLDVMPEAHGGTSRVLVPVPGFGCAFLWGYNKRFILRSWWPAGSEVGVPKTWPSEAIRQIQQVLGAAKRTGAEVEPELDEVEPGVLKVARSNSHTRINPAARADENTAMVFRFENEKTAEDRSNALFLAMGGVPRRQRRSSRSVQKPKKDFARLVLFDKSQDEPSVAMIGHVLVETDKQGKKISISAAAEKNYGPMLYEAIASILGQPVYPSDTRSRRAEKFWAKQPERVVMPLSEFAFEQKYGKSLASMIEASIGIDNMFIEAMIREGEGTAMSAEMAERENEHNRTYREEWKAMTRVRQNRRRDEAIQWLDAAKSNPKIMPYLPITSIPSDEADFPRAPVELTSKAERLTVRSKPIFPGLILHEQRSKTDKPLWVTFTDGREILYVSDHQGRETYIYRSFSGTDGKSQGYWYPVGGLLAWNGKGLWIIKSGLSNPGQYGMGRSQLTAFIEYINQVMPHSDAEVDALLVSIGGQINPGWSLGEDVETKPIMNVLLPLVPPQSEEANSWRRWAVSTWKEIGLNKVWGVRDML